MQDSETTESATCGKAAVRELLIDRLNDAGLRRSRGVTREALEKVQARLAEGLAYMTPENLQTLAEVVMDNCDGEWPAEVVIRSWARALQAPPEAEKRIVTSWLASVEGPQAEAGGYLVELYGFLRLHGRPPLAYDMSQIRARAGDNARRRMMIRDRIERDAANDEDHRWLTRYEADLRAARAVVAAGAGRREAGA